MERNYKLDAMKGISIILILITHFSWSDDQRRLLLFPFWIEMAVPIFMMITGFVYTMSFDKGRCQKLQDGYSLKIISKRIFRYLIPYLMIFIIELFIYYLFFENHSILFLIMTFITGGFGPGAYYIPVLLQIVFLMPLVYFVIRSNPLIGIINCFIFNMLYEIVKTLIGMPNNIYRLCAFRYIFVLAFGSFLYFYKENIKMFSMIIIGGIGGGFLVYTGYIGSAPSFLRNWTGTCCIACLFLCPFMYQVLNYGNNLKNNMICYIGKASYNIYLFQMLYYWICFSVICNHINNRLLQLLISILICLTVGCLFYKIENPFTNYVVQRLV